MAELRMTTPRLVRARIMADRMRTCDQAPETVGRAGAGSIRDHSVRPAKGTALTRHRVLRLRHSLNRNGGTTLSNQSAVTEIVVRRHLRAFMEHEGIDAILEDYADDASFMSEGRVYCGKSEIREFFEGLMAMLSPRAIREFSLRSLRITDSVGYITWGMGSELPLGTDTFVVRDGRIVVQTCAMHVPAAA